MTALDLPSRLRRRAKRAGVSVSSELADRMGDYFELLFRWNAKINLTSLVDQDEAVDRLLLEPLMAGKYLDLSDETVLDVGSGGGSPAIPLKLSHPAISLVMVESKVRKSAFLREAVRYLQLADVRVETRRFEEMLTQPELHEAVDLVSIRAVRAETKVLNSLQAFLKPGGRIAWFRGAGVDTKPPAIHPPLTWDSMHPLVESLGSRLVVMRKAPLGLWADVPRGT